MNVSNPTVISIKSIVPIAKVAMKSKVNILLSFSGSIASNGKNHNQYQGKAVAYIFKKLNNNSNGNQYALWIIPWISKVILFSSEIGFNHKKNPKSKIPVEIIEDK